MQVIGHRGAATLAPENTWASFELALNLGVDAIETDVRATSDGQLVLVHDEGLDRTTNSQGLIVHETSWSIIQNLDAGSWFSTEFQGARVPRLRETLERYGQSTHLVLEIKQPGTERDVLEMVKRLDLLQNVTFTSFQFEAVHSIKTSARLAKVGFLTSDMRHHNVQRTLDARMEQFCPPANKVTRSLVVEWKRLGLEVRAWGVNNPDLMKQAVEAGVDGMTVDFPHLLQEALGRHHATLACRIQSNQI